MPCCLCAQGLSAVASRLDPKEAAEAAAILTLAMSKTTEPSPLYRLAQGLSAVASRLEPKRLPGRVATLLSPLPRP